MFSRKIRVTMVDVSTGRQLVESKMPPEHLPETFSIATTMHIGQDDWEVVSADPVTAEEFKRVKRLTLTVRRVEKVGVVPAGEIRYSLPTLCDAIPPVAPGTSRVGRDVYELHEDDWRQMEAVIMPLLPLVEAELEAIEGIYRDHNENGHGFRALYVRSRIPRPLGGSLSMARLRLAFPDRRDLDGIAYSRGDELIDGGFAFEVDGAIVYGRVREGDVEALCLGSYQDDDTLVRVIPRLMDVTDGLFVNWPAHRKIV